MSQAKPKQLTMNKIKKEAIAINKMETYEINDTETIKFYPVFPEGKVIDLLNELGDDMAYAEEKGFDVDDSLFIAYIQLLCIKYFTSLEKGFAKNFEGRIKQLDYLIDAGYFTQILDEVFSQEEVKKVIDTIMIEISKSKFIEETLIESGNRFEKMREEKLEQLKD